MKIIDAHTHVFPHYADLAVRTMDQCDVECCVTLEWHDGFGETLNKHVKAFNKYPGRFVVFGNVDFSRINERGFGQTAAKQMEQDVEAGMHGLKVYKALGLEYRDGEGNFWRVNDERLDPIWEKAGELHIPVIIHTADPAAFWQPINEHNFWNAVLYGEYDWWTYYRKNYPSRDELLAERNDVIRRHPDTTFICPHLGSRADCLRLATDDLDVFPNLYYDLSARIPTLGLPGRHAEQTREFFITYRDRILFGTDSIYDDINVPTGMQAQCLYQPGEIPLEEGETPEGKYISTSVEFLKSHIDFLTTDKLQSNPPFKRNRSGFAVQGINLPEEVCERVLWKNAQRLIPMLD
jgi:predicted TIM-barrel fold metal-dependent hydrolase